MGSDAAAAGAAATRDFYSLRTEPALGCFSGRVLVVSDSGTRELEEAMRAFLREFPEARVAAGGAGQGEAGEAPLFARIDSARPADISRLVATDPGGPLTVVFAERKCVESEGPEIYGLFDLCIAV